MLISFFFFFITALEVVHFSAPRPTPKFHVDQPFIYAIIQKNSHAFAPRYTMKQSFIKTTNNFYQNPLHFSSSNPSMQQYQFSSKGEGLRAVLPIFMGTVYHPNDPNYSRIPPSEPTSNSRPTTQWTKPFIPLPNHWTPVPIGWRGGVGWTNGFWSVRRPFWPVRRYSTVNHSRN